MDVLLDPFLLPSCILAGVGTVFLMLAFGLPPVQLVGMVAGTALMIGLALARLRREAAEDEPVCRRAPVRVRG